MGGEKNDFREKLLPVFCLIIIRCKAKASNTDAINEYSLKMKDAGVLIHSSLIFWDHTRAV
ncbi:MAG TPA: hypothetical protein PLK12_10235 [Prolixibacteraceae bacterium]|nr:hypothetical protein [Prolixibacteraceae bacterium]